MGKGIIETDKYMTEGQRILYEDMGKAILKYCNVKFGVGFGENGQSVLFGDVKMMNSSKGDGWIKLEFYFKVVK